MLITREVINKNITFLDSPFSEIQPKIFNYDDVCYGIDHIKSILLSYNCQPGQSVLIGLPSTTLQIAAFFACAELGLQVIILDHSRDDRWINIDYIDPKTKSLLPINYYIFDRRAFHPVSWARHNFLKNNSDHNVELDIKKIYHKFYDVHTTDILAKDTDILLKCTSSGTTGTAKLVKHSHHFLHDLIKRNRVFYHGCVCMILNLNHGSSPATYFLPAVCSENTTHFISYKMQTFDVFDFKKLSDKIIQLNVEHLMIPYSYMIDRLFNNGANKSDLNLYTLSTIQKDWLKYYKQEKVKNIISFFGCNETSGPLLINEIKDIDFSEWRYKLFDDFYKLNTNEGKNLEVMMPVYDATIYTNDKFDVKDGYFFYMGRNDLYRVNGLEVNLDAYSNLVSEQLDGTIIIDTAKDKLYLAIWDDIQDIDFKISELNSKLASLSNGVHQIQKFKSLNKDKFYSGVKLDMELLRDYFRNYVN
jgi:hypothetical protein